MSSPESTTHDEAPAEVLREREPYTPPTIEMFPPMHDVTFGTNVNPLSATVVVP